MLYCLALEDPLQRFHLTRSKLYMKCCSCSEAKLSSTKPIQYVGIGELEDGRIFAAGPKSKAYTQVFGRNMPQASAQFLIVLLGKPAQRSLLLYQMVSSNLCLLFARPNRELSLQF